MLHVTGESLKRFKHKHPQAPLQGLIRNNILLIRPAAEGGIEATPNTDLYDVKIQPNLGIPPPAAIERLRLCKEWTEAGRRAPKPEWELLDQGFHFDGEEREPGEADEGIMLDFRFEALELAEHQTIMLQPPEQRIQQIVYPELVQATGRPQIQYKAR